MRQVVEAVVMVEHDGQRVGLVLPDLKTGGHPADDPPVILLSGLRRRWAVAMFRECECGATLDTTHSTPHADGIRRVDVEHENACPAVDSVFLPALQLWLGGVPRGPRR